MKTTENGRKTTLVGAPNPILEQVATEDREEDTEQEPSQGDSLQMSKEKEETLESPSLKEDCVKEEQQRPPSPRTC